MVNVTPKLEDFSRTMSKQRTWEVKHKITVILQARKRAESSSDRHIAYIASKSLAFQQKRCDQQRDVIWCDQQRDWRLRSVWFSETPGFAESIFVFFLKFPEKNGNDWNLGLQKSGLQIGAIDILLIGKLGPILLIILDVSMNHLTIVSPIFWWFHTVQLLNFDLISKAIVSCISHFMTTDLVQPYISISSWKHLVLIVKPSFLID